MIRGLITQYCPMFDFLLVVLCLANKMIAGNTDSV